LGVKIAIVADGESAYIRFHRPLVMAIRSGRA
jgi:hypothetical protein